MAAYLNKIYDLAENLSRILQILSVSISQDSPLNESLTASFLEKPENNHCNGHLRKPHAGWSLIKSPLSSLLKRPLSPDSLAFIASPA
jgi:hypothetical protein